MRLFVALFALAAPNSLIADDGSVGDLFRAVEPQAFVHAFVGTCVHNPGRLDKVGSGAEALGYAETPEPFWTLFAPQDPDIPYFSWMAMEGEGSPFVLGVSEAPMLGETYQICAISNPFLDAEKVLTSLEQLVELGATVADDTVAGQRTRVWLTPRVLDGAFISSNDIRGMGVQGVTLSLAAPKQYK